MVKEAEELSPGEGMQESPEAFIPPPVVWFVQKNLTGTMWLNPQGEDGRSYVLEGPDGHACRHDPERGFAWNGALPRQVTVRWSEHGKDYAAIVPVLDSHGRIGATPVPPMNLDTALAHLAEFPKPTSDDEDIDDDPPAPDPDDKGGENRGAPSQLPGGSVANYPIRAVSQFIERIAAQQAGVHRLDWTAWCHRLEQTLEQVKDCAELAYCRELNLNVLPALEYPPFLPDFAEDPASLEHQRYAELLKRLAEAWGLADFRNLGSVP
jgi:hypothetical protein